MSEVTIENVTTNTNDGESISQNFDITNQFESILTSLTNFRGQITQVQQEIRILEKAVKKEVKGLKRDAGKSKARGNRKLCGFAKPSKISPELCEFMKKAEGSCAARTEVTQFIINYINEKKLQDPVNRKTIKPDDKLRKLLGVSHNDELNYFNLQKFMNKHFPSNTQAEEKAETLS